MFTEEEVIKVRRMPMTLFLIESSLLIKRKSLLLRAAECTVIPRNDSEFGLCTKYRPQILSSFENI